MTRPIIDSGDILTSTGSGTTGAVDHQAYGDGDLMLAFIGIDDDLTANNPSAPSTGPNGETLIESTVGSGGSSGGGPTQGFVAWVGTATRSAGTIDFTWTGSEFWAGRCIKVLAGEFDATTPLGALSGYSGNTSDSGTTVATPSWALDADDGGGAIVVHMVVDADPLSGTPSGWTLTVNTDHGGLSTAITQRDADSVDSETVASVDYTTSADSSSTLGTVVRPPKIAQISDVDSDYGAASDEFDVDENSLDVNGSLFEASQGTGTVWLADETTLAASNAEVDLDAAINTWGDTEVNLNLPNLSAGDKTSVEALIVSDGPALFIILVNDSADETSLPVTVHRAKAFAMSLSGNIATSGENTTGQLTAPTSGSFGGGRIQDDENPTDTVDIGDDEYFEDEWCIEALAASVYDETYLFRVLVGTSPAATITVTPGLTVEAALGDLTAAIATTLTVAADLSAQGKLDAALALALTTALDLTAKGELAAANSILLAIAADITGAGELTAPLLLTLSTAADLKAAGELTAPLNLALTVAAQLSAEGNLAAAMSLVNSVTATLSAEGRLAASNTILLSLTADLEGAGALSAGMNLAVSVAADLDAAGSLAAANSILVSVTASITEGDLKDLTAILNLTLTVAAAMSAEGTLSAANALALSVAADLSAAGKLEAAATLALAVAADLKGAGLLTAALSLQLAVAADLDAVGNLSASVVTALSVAAALSAAGRLDAAMNLVVTVAADIEEASLIDLDASLPITVSVSAAIDALGNLAAAPALVMSAAADLSAQGRIEAATNLLIALAADLEGAGLLRTVLGLTTTVAADIRGLGELRATPLITLSMAANITEAGVTPPSAAVFRDVWQAL